MMSPLQKSAFFIATTLLALCISTTVQAQSTGANSAPPPSASQFIPFSVPTTKMQPVSAGVSTDDTAINLNQSLDKSLTQSPRMAGVRASLGIARSAYAQATVMPNPGFYISNTYHNAYFFGASIPVEPPWKLCFRLLVAKRQVEQVRLDILRNMWLFRGEVRRRYAELVIAEELVRERAKLRDLADRIVNSSAVAFDSGNVPNLDVRRAKLAFIQAKMDFRQAEIQASQAREQLNILMGEQAGAALSVKGLPEINDTKAKSELLPNFKKQYPDRLKLTETALTNRLELKIARQAIAVNKANKLNTIGNILPTPRFVVGKALEVNPPFPGPSQHVGFFQAYIDAPVFNFQQGDLAKFKATGLQLELDLKSQENQIAAQVSLAYHKMVAARERIRDFISEALPESEAVTQISKHGYDLGQIDLNTLLDTQRANIQMKTQYYDAVLNYQLAVNDLEQSIGIILD
jgi:outer membrane protein TolC